MKRILLSVLITVVFSYLHAVVIQVPKSILAKHLLVPNSAADIFKKINECLIQEYLESNPEFPDQKVSWCTIDSSIYQDILYRARNYSNQDNLLNLLLLDAVQYRMLELVRALLQNRSVDCNYHNSDNYSVISLSSQSPMMLQMFLDYTKVSDDTISCSSVIRRAADNPQSLKVFLAHQRVSEEVINQMSESGLNILYSLFNPTPPKKALLESELEDILLPLFYSGKIWKKTILARNAFGENTLFVAHKSLKILQQLLNHKALFTYDDLNITNYNGETILHAYLRADTFERSCAAMKLILNDRRFNKALVFHRSNKQTVRERLEMIEEDLKKRKSILPQREIQAIAELKKLLHFIEQVELKKSRL